MVTVLYGALKLTRIFGNVLLGKDLRGKLCNRRMAPRKDDGWLNR